MEPTAAAVLFLDADAIRVHGGATWEGYRRYAACFQRIRPRFMDGRGSSKESVPLPGTSAASLSTASAVSDGSDALTVPGAGMLGPHSLLSRLYGKHANTVHLAAF